MINRHENKKHDQRDREIDQSGKGVRERNQHSRKINFGNKLRIVDQTGAAALCSLGKIIPDG